VPLNESSAGPEFQGLAAFPAILGEYIDVLTATGARTEAALEEVIRSLTATE